MFQPLHEFAFAQPGLDPGQEFDNRQTGFAINAALGPEQADIGGHRHAILSELFIKNAGADLVRRLDARGAGPWSGGDKR